MGRGKIEIKRIENVSNREVTFSKRKKGLEKKAKELGILCDAKISLLIFSAAGRMYHFCSPSTSLVTLLETYQEKSGRRLWDAKHEYLNNEIERMKKENQNMQIELRHLKGDDITSLNFEELAIIEDALERGVEKVRSKQVEYLKMMQENQRNIEEENDHLRRILHQQHINGSFSFRVQPNQPNLQQNQ